MSFTENDRSFRSKKGKSFPGGDEYNNSTFAVSIAEALKAEFGTAAASAKQVARLTRSNERTARNWIEGRNSPSGENLVILIRHSDAVFEAVLALSHRSHLPADIHLGELRGRLMMAVAAIDQVEPPAS